MLGSRSSSESKEQGDPPSDAQTGVEGVEGLEGTLWGLFWERILAEDDAEGCFSFDMDGLGVAGVSFEVNVVPHRIDVAVLKVEWLCGPGP